MSFSDHKITAFTHRIADLPDQPNLPADELKARFDSSREELRQAVNGICDDASRLEARVEGIVVDTFGDTIDREMLSDELAAELDAKATQTALTAEEQAREALSGRVSALETAVPQKARCAYGTYTGNGTENRLISVGFRPYLVFVGRTGTMTYYGMFTNMATMIDGANTKISSWPAHLETGGFRVSQSENNKLNNSDNFNQSGVTYGYIAIGV